MDLSKVPGDAVVGPKNEAGPTPLHAWDSGKKSLDPGDPEKETPANPNMSDTSASVPLRAEYLPYIPFYRYNREGILKKGVKGMKGVGREKGEGRRVCETASDCDC
jgi:hypothetical protein